MPSLHQSTGAVSLPITAQDLNGSNVFPDQARDVMLALFKAAINAELSSAWSSAVTDTPLEGTDPVEDTLPMEPDPRVLKEQKKSFPLLTLHREGTAETEDLTLSKEKTTQRWTLNYFISPLNIEHLHRVSAVPQYVAAIVRAVISQGGHPAYESGSRQFTGDKGGLYSVRFASQESGQASFADEDDGARYLALTMTIETVEVESFTGSEAPYHGSSLNMSTGTTEGLIPEFVRADTQIG